MNSSVFDELSTEWQEANAAASTKRQREHLIAATCRKTERFWAQVFRRDLIETAAALFVIFSFSRMQWQDELNLWERLGAGIVVVGAIYIVFRIWLTKRKTPPASLDAPLREYCRIELVRLESQIHLLQTVLSWYLAPIMGGLTVMSIGKHGLSLSFLSDLALYGLIAWGLTALNRWTARKHLVPLRNQLHTLLTQLDHPEEEFEHETLLADSAPPSTGKRLMQTFTYLLLFGVIFWVFLLSKVSYTTDPRNEGQEADSLAGVVAEARQEKNLVGLSAMVMVDGKVVASAVDGERKQGSRVWLEEGDRWHLGSITKSITSTMVARLIEADRMKWTDTVGKYFPEAAVHEDWQQVTVRQLMTHTSGAPANFSLAIRLKKPPAGKQRMRARSEAVLEVISVKPDFKPGTDYKYSNVGYTILGTMAEKAIGKSWEELVELGVYQPLKLDNAGFGPPKSPDKTLDQPRGHRTALGMKTAMDDKADNTPIMGPCGTAHMTLNDLCTYANEHLLGHLGKGTLLSKENYKLLHEPVLDNYACGWVKPGANRRIPYPHFWHNGSNTMWYALVVFVPEKNAVVAVASNDGDIQGAESAAWEIVAAMAAKYGFGQDSTPAGRAAATGSYPKLAPYDAIRWAKTGPEVRVEGSWFRLISIDELPVVDIVAASKEQHGKRLWKKRFEEDLVEVLTRMGHPPGGSVTLSLESVDTGNETVKRDVPLTEQNRWKIKNAAGGR